MRMTRSAHMCAFGVQLANYKLMHCSGVSDVGIGMARDGVIISKSFEQRLEELGHLFFDTINALHL